MNYNVLVVKKGVAGVPEDMFNTIHKTEAHVIVGFNEDGTVQKGNKINPPFIVGKKRDGTIVVCEVDPKYFENPSPKYIKKEYKGLGAVVETKGIKLQKRNIHTAGLWSTVSYLILPKEVYEKYVDIMSPHLGIVEEIGDEEEG